MRTATHCHECGSKLPEHTDPHIYHDPSIYHDQSIYPHTDQHQSIYPHTDQHITQERYKVLAREIERDIRYIGDKSQPKHARLAVVDRLRQTLDDCLNDENLDHLTRIYINTTPTTKIHVGYNQSAVAAFAMEMLMQYA